MRRSVTGRAGRFAPGHVPRQCSLRGSAMIKLPAAVWSRDLGDGTTLQERVGKVDPTCWPLVDLLAFRNVWTQRLDDGRTRNLLELCAKSQAILNFTSEHEEISLLMWPEIKVTALYAPQSESLLLIEKLFQP